MITAQEYAVHRNRIDKYHATMDMVYPGRCSFEPAMIANICTLAGIDRAPTNEERSAVEVYEFVTNPPDKYFLYINCTKREATTWTGDKLGTVGFGNDYRDNFGGKRVPITVYAINGKKYHGTYFKSAGDYARIKMCKRSSANMVKALDLELLAELS